MRQRPAHPPAQRTAEHLQRLRQADRAVGTDRHQIGQPLGKRTLGTGGMIAEAAAHVQTQLHAQLTDWEIRWRARRAAVDARCGLLTAWTLGRRTDGMCRNDERSRTSLHSVNTETGK